MPVDTRYIHRAKDQVFTHENLDAGKGLRTWNVGAIMRVMIDLSVEGKTEVLTTPVDPDFAKYCMNMRGVEQHRLDRMVPKVLMIPCLFLAEPDGTHLMLDGTHRYVYAYQNGIKEVRCLIVPQDVADKARMTPPPITDMIAYQKSFSGIR